MEETLPSTLVAETYYLLGQYDKALELHKQALRDGCCSHELMANIGKTYLALGEFDKAKDFLTKGMSSHDPRVRCEATINYASIKYQEGDYFGASECVEEVIPFLDNLSDDGSFSPKQRIEQELLSKACYLGGMADYKYGQYFSACINLDMYRRNVSGEAEILPVIYLIHAYCRTERHDIAEKILKNEQKRLDEAHEFSMQRGLMYQEMADSLYFYRYDDISTYRHKALDSYTHVILENGNDLTAQMAKQRVNSLVLAMK